MSEQKREAVLVPDMITEMSEVAGGTKKEATKYLKAFETVVVNSLKAGKEVKLQGFVNFELKDVDAYIGRNPSTGDDAPVEAHVKASAKLAKGLRKL